MIVSKPGMKKTSKIVLILLIILGVSGFNHLVKAAENSREYEVNSYKDIMVENMMTMAEIIGTNITSSLVFNDKISAMETLKSLKAEQYILNGVILNNKGEAFVSYHKNSDGQNKPMEEIFDPGILNDLKDQDLAQRFNIHTLELHRKIVLDGDRIGVIVIKSSLDGLYARLKNHIVATGAILAVVFVVAFFMSSLFQKIITEPIMKLSRTMDKVTSEGVYSIRATSQKEDEIGELVSGFNSMLSKIESRDKQLAENRLELEERVDQRTLELKNANRNLEDMVENLARAKNVAEEASRTKSDFLANMSHELRTPLNHIIGFTELVMEHSFGDLNEIQREYLGDVLHSSRHLLSLINDILDLAKVESGKLELHISNIHLPMMLEGSLNMVREASLKNSIQLLLDIENIPTNVMADERKLKQIIFNLLSNAVKFTPKGGTVTLSAGILNGKSSHETMVLNEQTPQVMKISVSDTGIGIEEEDLDRIFNAFEQVENSRSRKYQGTGLGLSLTKRLVELHGGKIWAESRGMNLGTIISFTLPTEEIFASFEG
ncbi:MAG: HAMP domain-containing protein [Desulfobacteraceae bacterium]|nr:HAMP domain-containing protein [Desulfobacteraceae bacterium]MBU4001430.1 HAMP domain-containing protein [Pseudomonadota bacterium]MBU4052752.1 HAMP domain-containing protein [Pseudomonadota bacterium]